MRSKVSVGSHGEGRIQSFLLLNLHSMTWTQRTLPIWEFLATLYMSSLIHQREHLAVNRLPQLKNLPGCTRCRHLLPAESLVVGHNGKRNRRLSSSKKRGGDVILSVRKLQRNYQRFLLFIICLYQKNSQPSHICAFCEMYTLT